VAGPALRCLPIMRGALRKPQAGAAHGVQINTDRKLDVVNSVLKFLLVFLADADCASF
jgi:hypothetical protein